MIMEVEWHKCHGNIWCNIFKVDSQHKNIRGFNAQYILWSGKFQGEQNTLVVGYGDISKAVEKYREDIAIKAFEHLGVFITWADIPSSKRKQIHNYLLRKLSPTMTKEKMKGGELEINLPLF